MKFLQMFFLFYFQDCGKNHFKFFLKNSNTFSVNNKNKKSTGYDERYPINETDTEENLKFYKIKEFHKKKILLDTLQNNSISINTKLNLLKDNSIKPSNIKAGGLFKDFDFKLD